MPVTTDGPPTQMPAARMLIPEAGHVFSDAYLVPQTTAHRVLQNMARKAPRLCLSDAAGARERGAIVFDQIDGDPNRLLLKQLEDGARSRPVFVVGDAVKLHWSDGGARHWVDGQVLRVDAQEQVYEVALNGRIYRAQQRATQRIPIASDDPVTAQLYVELLGDLLDATVKDLSVAGGRLAVDAQRMRYTEPEPSHRAVVNLVLPPSDQIISNDARIVWAARVSANTMHVSVAWILPTEKFLTDVKRYLGQKISGV